MSVDGHLENFLLRGPALSKEYISVDFEFVQRIMYLLVII